MFNVQFCSCRPRLPLTTRCDSRAPTTTTLICMNALIQYNSMQNENVSPLLYCIDLWIYKAPLTVISNQPARQRPIYCAVEINRLNFEHWLKQKRRRRRQNLTAAPRKPERRRSDLTSRNPQICKCSECSIRTSEVRLRRRNKGTSSSRAGNDLYLLDPIGIDCLYGRQLNSCCSSIVDLIDIRDVITRRSVIFILTINFVLPFDLQGPSIDTLIVLWRRHINH